VTDAFGRIKALLEKRGERIEDFDAAIAASHSGVSSAAIHVTNRFLLRFARNFHVRPAKTVTNGGQCESQLAFATHNRR